MKEDRVLQKLIDKYDSEIDVNDCVSSNIFLNAIVEAYQTGYIEGYRDDSLNKNPKYILAIFSKKKVEKAK